MDKKKKIKHNYRFRHSMCPENSAHRCACVTWSNGGIPSKQVQPPASQTEMLNDVEDFDRFLHISHFGLFCDDQVNVNICMDEVSVDAPAHCSFNSHQAVLLEAMKCTHERIWWNLVQLSIHFLWMMPVCDCSPPSSSGKLPLGPVPWSCLDCSCWSWSNRCPHIAWSPTSSNTKMASDKV